MIIIALLIVILIICNLAYNYHLKKTTYVLVIHGKSDCWNVNLHIIIDPNSLIDSSLTIYPKRDYIDTSKDIKVELYDKNNKCIYTNVLQYRKKTSSPFGNYTTKFKNSKNYFNYKTKVIKLVINHNDKTEEIMLEREN